MVRNSSNHALTYFHVGPSEEIITGTISRHPNMCDLAVDVILGGTGLSGGRHRALRFDHLGLCLQVVSLGGLVLMLFIQEFVMSRTCGK